MVIEGGGRSADAIRIAVRLRGALAARLPGSERSLELPVGSTVETILPKLGLPVVACVYVVNGSAVAGGRTLRDGDRVQVIPPMAGGDAHRGRTFQEGKRVMSKLMRHFGLIGTVLLVVGGCSGAATSPPVGSASPSAVPTKSAGVPSATAQASAGPSATAQASAVGPNLQALIAKGTMVCGTSADFPPYESKDANGNFVGFDMDLIREIAKQLGVEVQIQDMSFDAIIASVQQKKLDCGIAALQITGENTTSVEFSTDYDKPVQGVVIMKGSGVTINEPEDLAGYKVGTQAGGSNENWVVDNLIKTGKMPKTNLFSYPKIDQEILDLKAGRIDAALTGGANAVKLAETDSTLAVALLSEKIVASGHVIAFPRGWTDVTAAVDAILNKLKADGTIGKLQVKHSVLVAPGS